MTIKNTQIFTRPWVVKDMLNMLDSEIWTDPASYFYEPSFGDGAFLIGVMKKSYRALKKHYSTIPSKKDHAREIALSETLNKIQGIELDEKYVIKARQRCFRFARAIMKMERRFDYVAFSEYMTANVLMDKLEHGDFFKRFGKAKKF